MILITLMSINFLAYAEDMPSSWAKEYTEEVMNQDILLDTFFNGFQKPITRREFAYLGVKLCEFYTGVNSEIGDASFIDSNDEWVLKAKKLGLVGGYPDGSFKPDNPIKRDELAVLFHNIFKATGAKYVKYNGELFEDDDSIASWAKESVYIAKANGIIGGVGGNKFNPSGQATKEQAIIMFSRGQESKTVVKPKLDNLTFEDNFFVDGEYSSETQKLTLSLDDFPFDFYETVALMPANSSAGTEYNKIDGQMVYMLSVGRKNPIDISEISPDYINVNHVIEFNNANNHYKGYTFYDYEGYIIGFMMLHKLNEGTNKLEFCRWNENGLSEEIDEYNRLRQEQLENAQELKDEDVMIVDNINSNMYSIFIEDLETGPYKMTVSSYSGGPLDLIETAIIPFQQWILRNHSVKPVYKWFYLPFVGFNESRIYENTGRGTPYLHYPFTIYSESILTHYMDTTLLDPNNAITEHNNIYYMKLIVENTNKESVDKLINNLEIRINYNNQEISNSNGGTISKQTLNYKGHNVSSIYDYSTEGSDGLIKFERVLGPFKIDDLNLFSYDLINGEEYEIKVLLEN